jgi:hypothetical protein
MRAVLHQAGLVLGVKAWVDDLVRLWSEREKKGLPQGEERQRQQDQGGAPQGKEQQQEEERPQEQQRRQVEGRITQPAQRSESAADGWVPQASDHGFAVPTEGQEAECRAVIEQIRTRVYGESELLLFMNQLSCRSG